MEGNFVGAGRRQTDGAWKDASSHPSNRAMHRDAADPRPHHRLCRVCHKSTGALIVPCACRGTISHAHAACMREWVLRTRSATCGVCQESFAVSCVFDDGAPPPPRPSTGDDNKQAAAAPLTITGALRIIGRNVGSQMSHRLVRGCFFIGVWLIALPLFLSLVWQTLFNFSVVMSGAEQLWARAVSHARPSLVRPLLQEMPTDESGYLDTNTSKEWLQQWYVPGLQLIVVGWIAVMMLGTWWEWCIDTIATFEDPTNFETLPGPEGEIPHGRERGAIPSPTTSASSSSGSNSENEDMDAPEEAPRMTNEATATAATLTSHANETMNARKQEEDATNVAQGESTPTSSSAPMRPATAAPRPTRHQSTATVHHPSASVPPQGLPRANPSRVPATNLIRSGDLGRIIDTLGERAGGRLLGTGAALDGQGSVLDHFGLSGSLMSATAIAIAFGVVFVPAVLFALLKLPFMIGSLAGWSLVSAVDWLGAATLPVDVEAAVGASSWLPWCGALWAVVAHALTGIPVHQLTPSMLGVAVRAPLPRPQYVDNGSYIALSFLSWATGALILCGVVVQLSCWSRAELRKALQIGSAFVRGLIINVTHIAFLPAIHGLLLCLLTVGYWVPQRPTAFWPTAHDDVSGAQQTSTVVAAMSLLPRLPIVSGYHSSPTMANRYAVPPHRRVNGTEGASEEVTTRQQVLQPLSPLTLMKAMSIVDGYLVRKADDATRGREGRPGVSVVDVERLFMLMAMSTTREDGAPLIECGQGRASNWQAPCPQLSPVLHLLTKQPASPSEAVWRFRLYCIGTLLTRVHLFSDGLTWLPLFVSGLMFASVFWHCCYHVRRLVNPQLLKWLFRDPADTPMVQQVIRCKSAMVPIFMVRNVVLVALSCLVVVRPAFWVLSCLFHQNVPVLLSWSSGNAVVDVLCANLVVFGGRVARVMALVRGNGNFEDEVLFRRFAMVADFLREAHETFFERVGGDLRVLAFLRTASAPSSSHDFFFPIRVMAFILTYVVMAALLVFAILLPGVAVNHAILNALPHDESVLLHSGHSDSRHSAGGAWLGSASFETHELLAAISVLAADVPPIAGGGGVDTTIGSETTSPSLPHSLYASLMAMSGEKRSAHVEDHPPAFRPLTMHAVIIGWSLLLCASQIYVLLAPHIAHAAMTLRHKYLRPSLIQATWLQALIESATVGVVALRHHTVLIGPRHDRPTTVSITGYTVRYEGAAEWLCSKRTMRLRCERALELLGPPPPNIPNGDVDDVDGRGPSAQLAVHRAPSEDPRRIHEAVHQVLTDVLFCLASSKRPPTRTLSTAGARLLGALLTDPRHFPRWQQWLSLTVYAGLLSAALCFGPLLLGSGMLRLCCSGSIRTSTQYMTLFASTASFDPYAADDVQSLGAVVDGSWQYWCTSWAFGVIVIALLSVYWTRHFPATTRILADFYRVGMLQCASSATSAGRVAAGVVGSVLWHTAGCSFLPITITRWSRYLFVETARFVASGRAYAVIIGALSGADAAATSLPMSASLESLMVGYREPSDAETLLLHFGVLEWFCVIGWIVLEAFVADQLPFLPQVNAWLLEDLMTPTPRKEGQSSPPPGDGRDAAPPPTAAAHPSNGAGLAHNNYGREPTSLLPREGEHAPRDGSQAVVADNGAQDDDDEEQDDVLPALMAAADDRAGPQHVWPRWSLRRWLEGQATGYSQASYDAMYLVDIVVHDRSTVQGHVADNEV